MQKNSNGKAQREGGRNLTKMPKSKQSKYQIAKHKSQLSQDFGFSSKNLYKKKKSKNEESQKKKITLH